MLRFSTCQSSGKPHSASLSTKEVTKRVEQSVDQAMSAYAAGDICQAGHALQHARFNARGLAKPESVMQAPRRGTTATFAAIVHHDQTGFRAAVGDSSDHLATAGVWAVDFENGPALGEVARRLCAAEELDAPQQLTNLANYTVASGSAVLVGALWGNASQTKRETVLNAVMMHPQQLGGYRSNTAPTRNRAMAQIAHRATWGAEPTQVPSEPTLDLLLV